MYRELNQAANWQSKKVKERKSSGAINIEYHKELKAILWGDKAVLLYIRGQKVFQYIYTRDT